MELHYKNKMQYQWIGTTLNIHGMIFPPPLDITYAEINTIKNTTTRENYNEKIITIMA